MGRKQRERRAAPSGFQASPGTVVTFSYELCDGDGDLVEASDPFHPVEVLYGYGQLAPALEQALGGMSAGQAKRIVLEPEQAFGNRRTDAIFEVPREELPADIQVGDELEAEAADGRDVFLKVLELAEDFAVLDANHPLAGQPVELDLVIEAVRPATADELREAERSLTQSVETASETLIPEERLLKRVGQHAALGGPAAQARFRLV